MVVQWACDECFMHKLKWRLFDSETALHQHYRDDHPDCAVPASIYDAIRRARGSRESAAGEH